MASPVRPSAPVTPWASGSYPSGSSSWSGQPKRVAPPTDGFTPGTIALPEYLNSLVGGQADKLAELDTFGKAMFDARLEEASANWGMDRSPNGGGTGAIQQIRWNATLGAWIVAAQTTTGNFGFYAVKDSGQAGVGTALGGFAGAVAGMATSPTTGNMVAFRTDGVPMKFDASALTWSAGSAAGATDADADVAYLASGTSAWAALQSGTWAFWYSTNDGVTSSVAATTISATGAGSMKIASSGTVLVAIPTNPGSPRVYATSTNGSTWTNRNLPSGSHVGNGTGVTWDAARGLFLVSAKNTLGTGATMLTSPDGVTWTQVMDQASFNVLDVMASPWGAAVAVASTGGANRVIYSVDGGQSWKLAESALPPAAGSGVNPNPRGPTLRAGGNRFACLNSSATYRLSQALGGLDLGTAKF